MPNPPRIPPPPPFLLPPCGSPLPHHHGISRPAPSPQKLEALLLAREKQTQQLLAQNKGRAQSFRKEISDKETRINELQRSVYEKEAELKDKMDDWGREKYAPLPPARVYI